MASIPDLSGNSDQERTIENVEKLTISKRTVRYGSSVYQVRNITGFKAGMIPKEKFPFQTVAVLTAAGLIIASFNKIGLLLLVLAGFLIFKHFSQIQYYGLRMFLNSGKEIFFSSKNQSFIKNLVTEICDLMDGQKDGLVIQGDFINNNVGRDMIGNAFGNDNSIDIKPE